MIHHSKFFASIMKWPLKLLVHTRPICSDAIETLAETKQPVVYVMENDSAVDTMMLAEITSKAGLPSPYSHSAHPSVLFISGKRFGRTHQTRLKKALRALLEAHKASPELDIQLLPVQHFWGRNPGKTKAGLLSWLAERPTPGWLRKAWTVLFLGRSHFVRLATPVSLHEFAERFGDNDKSAHRIARLARAHFYRQRLASTGPRLPNHKRMFKELSKNPAIAQITDADPGKQEQMRAQAQVYMKEIAATYSNTLVVILDRFMTWLWNRIYGGININNMEQVRQLAESGKEIVYVPCHRSHMDYMLLSYVIYQQGLVPPHIAAGINLNFWPAGPIFRRGGAFFIRRSFRGNKLYSTVFREYLSWLIKEGFPVEYFTEGGRSRTGRLLSPKTGMFAMTVQSQLVSESRPIVFVPIYLGYEHVMEVTTYLKELKGEDKEKESLWNSLKIIGKLRNYGQGFVNFGTPVSLDEHLTKIAPQWRQERMEDRPKWMSQAVNSLAENVMTEINNSAAVNGLTLSTLSLLSCEKRALSEQSLATFMDVCLSLARNAPYHENTTVPVQTGQQLLEQTLALEKLTVTKDTFGNVVSLDKYGQVVMTYYRNNIIHVFIIPSLVAALIDARDSTSKHDLLFCVKQLYPLLKAELFLGKNAMTLTEYVDAILQDLARQQLVEMSAEGLITPPEKRSEKRVQLRHLGQISAETIQRYSVVLELLTRNPDLSRNQLEKLSRAVAEQLGRLHGIRAPEFFDKQLFASLCIKLKNMELLEQTEEARQGLQGLRQLTSELVSTEVYQSIVQLLNQDQ
ncbi:glycerol-3-phosphate 1-O-acyltransferase PlsB [Echinimonas agarilytica]|uniref:Glycerol-3-phosphate acyltransferase n=1 Tax=Echinimonas agarilytica TaxID=1215918 RepID=A0AA41W7W5_9GAMM|nr:glycerol-3-phosphate 1-O-acyltransferase PlsB [Echinimonas agarilytica]MCM2680922.1 glycerol-3-phosphate 1-O-acyltransferase PlsB [Echinimonas agarilytica]